jgi:hypothetical protein
VWRTALDGDSQRLLALRRASRAIRDQRILIAVADVAADGSRPEPVAFAAIDVLLGYVRPTAAVTPVSGSRDVLIGSSASIDTTSGSAPVVGNVEETVRLALWHALEAAPGEAVRERAARALALIQAHAVARESAWPPGALTLTYLCGNTFRVRNTHSQGVRLSYDVYNVPGSIAEIGVPATDETVFTAPKAGTVRLLHLGRVVATKANGGRACTPPLELRWTGVPTAWGGALNVGHGPPLFSCGSP